MVYIGCTSFTKHLHKNCTIVAFLIPNYAQQKLWTRVFYLWHQVECTAITEEKETYFHQRFFQ